MNGNYDERQVIFVLSGWLRKNDSGRWITADFGPEEIKLGNQMRVRAASYLYKENPEATLIIVSGGWGRRKLGELEGAPKLCEVMERELIELGVKEKDILKEDHSNTTYEQLQELKKIIKDKQLKEVTIVTNRYHLDRVQTFIENNEELRRYFSEGTILLRSTEEILLKYEPMVWKKIIQEVYQSPAVKARIESEKKGIREIKAGTYKY